MTDPTGLDDEPDDTIPYTPDDDSEPTSDDDLADRDDLEDED